MNDIASHETVSEAQQTTSIIQAAAIPERRFSLEEGFLCFFVVVLGIILGGIAAEFIGLLMNWISIC